MGNNNSCEDPTQSSDDKVSFTVMPLTKDRKDCYTVIGSLGSSDTCYSVKLTCDRKHVTVNDLFLMLSTDNENDPKLSLEQNVSLFHTDVTDRVKFSNGLYFYKKARIKKVSCDQLDPLIVHKERNVHVKERRLEVIRKLIRHGGWIRMGNYKQKVYIEPGMSLSKKSVERSLK